MGCTAVTRPISVSLGWPNREYFAFAQQLRPLPVADARVRRATTRLPGDYGSLPSAADAVSRNCPNTASVTVPPMAQSACSTITLLPLRA